ncbi:hypothetical protein N7481_006863 [Penicillium waksmanii]|uniref:uncharacterized protein n=1 Tax=Penicillium waksmanii TaxID=69791 RepID=UPI0025474190|nr:uncharacterized protein N7481_006863 [Penicillium waksmanii]KAJ5979565.1 hypothetical protein N7481_006863 [Penicillium waksmanii]
MADDNYWQTVLITVPIIGATIATLFFLLRLYSRLLIGKKLDIGDLLMFFGLFFSYGATISTILAAVREGKTDIWGLGSEHRQKAALLFWITQTFWPLSQAFIKFSTIILLRNLLGSAQKLHLTTTILLIFTTAWGIASLLVNIFQCWPPQYFWLQESIQGTCIPSQTAFYISIGTLSLVEDILILSLPVAVVWRLKLALWDKIQLTGLFSIGSLYALKNILINIQL